MDNEKELLKQDLVNQESPKDIEKFIEDAELLGHKDIAELGRKKLQGVLEKADNVNKTSESQVSQVESMGGSQDEVSKRTQEVDQEIEEVKTQTTEKIEEVRNISTTDNIEADKNNTKVEGRISSEVLVDEGAKDGVSEINNEVKENDNKKNFDSIEKPKTVEEIANYRKMLGERFKELPEEYQKCTEDIMQLLDKPEGEEIARQSFGLKPNREKINEVFVNLKFKEMPIHGNTYSQPNDIFKRLTDKYPEKKQSYEKMLSLMEEHRNLLHENSLYNSVQNVYDNPKKIENLLKYSDPSKKIEGYDEPTMNLNNGWYNSRVGKKLVELGVMTQEDLQNKLNNFLKEAENKDEYLINGRKYPDSYESTINRFKKEFGILE